MNNDDRLNAQVPVQPTSECRLTFVQGREWCATHKQQMAACWQMAHGNLCSACQEWHTGSCRRVM